jgi:small-conductance mechanosensitive channel
VTLPDLATVLPDEAGLPGLLWTLGTALALVLAALLAHAVLAAVARRIVRKTRTATDEMMLMQILAPSRGILVGLALIGLGALDPPHPVAAGWIVAATRMVMPLLWGWLLIGLIRFGKAYVEAHSDIAASDNLAARRRRTRADILGRIAIILVMLGSAGLMLLSIPEVREIGLALVASAGLAGLAVGVAAQPLLKNLVGGFQLAFTEPVRIDDVIVYRGEWGRIERITLTYVVLRIWDQRRLVIPVSRLVEEPIENWTRQTSDLLGTVFLHVDHAADIDALRVAALGAVRSHRLWDGRTAAVQVTDMTPQTLELRVLMSARNGSEMFDLRCDVREAMVCALRRSLPGSLSRSRVVLDKMESAWQSTGQP